MCVCVHVHACVRVCCGGEWGRGGGEGDLSHSYHVTQTIGEYVNRRIKRGITTWQKGGHVLILFATYFHNLDGRGIGEARAPRGEI